RRLGALAAPRLCALALFATAAFALGGGYLRDNLFGFEFLPDFQDERLRHADLFGNRHVRPLRIRLERRYGALALCLIAERSRAAAAMLIQARDEGFHLLLGREFAVLRDQLEAEFGADLGAMPAVDDLAVPDDRMHTLAVGADIVAQRS